MPEESKSFRLSSLGKSARFRDYEDAFFWLDDAMLVNLCYNSTAPNIGLKLNMDRLTMKCYMSDTVLLISHAFDENGIISGELYKKLLFDKLEVSNGMVVENIVAQMLAASGRPERRGRHHIPSSVYGITSIISKLFPACSLWNKNTRNYSRGFPLSRQSSPSAAFLPILVIFERACRDIRIVLNEAYFGRIKSDTSVLQDKRRNAYIPDLSAVVELRPVVPKINEFMHVFHICPDINILKLVLSSPDLLFHKVTIRTCLQAINFDHTIFSPESQFSMSVRPFIPAFHF